MKIVVVGPGALGSLLAAKLAGHRQSSLDVRILDHNRQRCKTIASQGLRYQSDSADRTIPVNITTSPTIISAADLVILCVKSYAIRQCLRDILPYLTSDNTLVLALQNGISHLEIMAAELTGKNWAVGVTAQGATKIAPDAVRHAGQGMTKIGFLQMALAADDDLMTLLQQTATIMTAAGIETAAVADIENHIWRKLMINVGINALTAINNCKNGELVENKLLRDTMQAAVEEARPLAVAKNITLSYDPVQAAEDVCRATADNISSMLQDVRNRRKTEIDAINGAIVKLAGDMNISVPVNSSLVNQIKKIEGRYLQRENFP